MATSSGTSDEWTVVRSGKGGKKRGISLGQATRLAVDARASTLADCDCHDSPEEILKRTDALSKALDRALDDVRAAPFLPALQAAVEALRPVLAKGNCVGGDAGDGGLLPWRVLALGLGPLSSAASRCQLALGLLLAQQLGARISVFDPAFGPADTALLASRGCDLLPSAASAATAHAAVPGALSLLFMPHCEAELYEAVLAANWTAAALSRTAILGNSFSSYADRWASADPSQPHRNQRRRPDRVIAAGAHCAEHRVDAGAFAVASAFNELSLHSFAAETTEVILRLVPAAAAGGEPGEANAVT